KVLSLAEDAAPDDDLVFLPYVAPGEQGALWDPSLRGSIEGLSLRHGPAEIARALVDGIVLESRRCVTVLLAKGAAPVIRATGGMTRSRWFRERLANATGCDVVGSPEAVRSAGAVGAAPLCGAGPGRSRAAPTHTHVGGRSSDGAWIGLRWRLIGCIYAVEVLQFGAQ